jgi:hypothetical protein
MTDGNTEKKGARVALSKTQAASGPGKELVELSKGWLADGKFEAGELAQLKAWLARTSPDSLPAAQFLREEVDRSIIASGYLPNQLLKIQSALFRVIPKRERAEAKEAQQKVIQQEWEQRAPEREAAREASAEHSRRLRERYAGVWAHEPATDAQLEFIRSLGGSLPDTASKLEASDTINRLLGRTSTRSTPASRSTLIPLAVIGLILLSLLVECAVVQSRQSGSASSPSAAHAAVPRH